MCHGLERLEIAAFMSCEAVRAIPPRSKVGHRGRGAVSPAARHAVPVPPASPHLTLQVSPHIPLLISAPSMGTLGAQDQSPFFPPVCCPASDTVCKLVLDGGAGPVGTLGGQDQGHRGLTLKTGGATLSPGLMSRHGHIFLARRPVLGCGQGGEARSM